MSEDDPVPVVVPEPEEPPVEDVVVATPEPSVAPLLAEPDAQFESDAQPEVEAPVEMEQAPVASLDDVDVSPMARQRDLPRYTRRARRLQQEGLVKLRIEIDSHGDVAEVVLLSGIPDSDLNEAALEVARGWTFSPARKDGRRVSVSKDVEFEFTVRPDRTTSVRIRE
jgi:protein TonB